ncbi:hypothetical protein ENBRE01_2427 [Enteropsectra breve]|nr:hypothetical protein ENBRE01_2427 [Enteropsectra breve]
MSKIGITKYKAQTTAFNTISYLVFIRGLIAQLNTKQVQNAVIIMDNVLFTKGPKSGKKLLLLGTLFYTFRHNRLF